MRKTLQITEQTTNPGTIAGEIRPTIDALGWERRSETDSASADGIAVTEVSFPEQADDVFRIITSVSIEHLDIASVHTVWLTLQQGLRFATIVGIIRPETIPVSAIPIPLGSSLPFVMIPGDILRGHCDPATPVGVVLRIKARFIDIDIGEYVPSV